MLVILEKVSKFGSLKLANKRVKTSLFINNEEVEELIKSSLSGLTKTKFNQLMNPANSDLIIDEEAD